MDPPNDRPSFMFECTMSYPASVTALTQFDDATAMVACSDGSLHLAEVGRRDGRFSIGDRLRIVVVVASPETVAAAAAAVNAPQVLIPRAAEHRSGSGDTEADDMLDYSSLSRSRSSSGSSSSSGGIAAAPDNNNRVPAPAPASATAPALPSRPVAPAAAAAASPSSPLGEIRSLALHATGAGAVYALASSGIYHLDVDRPRKEARARCVIRFDADTVARRPYILTSTRPTATARRAGAGAGDDGGSAVVMFMAAHHAPRLNLQSPAAQEPPRGGTLIIPVRLTPMGGTLVREPWGPVNYCHFGGAEGPVVSMSYSDREQGLLYCATMSRVHVGVLQDWTRLCRFMPVRGLSTTDIRGIASGRVLCVAAANPPPGRYDDDDAHRVAVVYATTSSPKVLAAAAAAAAAGLPAPSLPGAVQTHVVVVPAGTPGQPTSGRTTIPINHNGLRYHAACFAVGGSDGGGHAHLMLAGCGTPSQGAVRTFRLPLLASRPEPAEAADAAAAEDCRASFLEAQRLPAQQLADVRVSFSVPTGAGAGSPLYSCWAHRAILALRSELFRAPPQPPPAQAPVEVAVDLAPLLLLQGAAGAGPTDEGRAQAVLAGIMQQAVYAGLPRAAAAAAASQVRQAPAAGDRALLLRLGVSCCVALRLHAALPLFARLVVLHAEAGTATDQLLWLVGLADGHAALAPHVAALKQWYVHNRAQVMAADASSVQRLGTREGLLADLFQLTGAVLDEPPAPNVYLAAPRPAKRQRTAE